uniref:potassium voltage-gated channel subfamily KQT member 4-like isoform X2 n=1 Tax=Styela clava TaxID=7725 RepID=UPI00193AA179|nr:potassium voltage-gated channel subfamily KQT member 4-like isoform X2 [Styela clava]
MDKPITKSLNADMTDERTEPMEEYAGDAEDWNMRRVQFSDVVQVEHGSEPESFDRREMIRYKMENLSEKFHSAVDVDDGDEDCFEKDENAFEEKNQMREGAERRHSLAAQLLMAPTKWAQQKEYRQRKMSLHGKPIYFTAPSRRKNEVRKLMILIFNFLERPGGGNNISLIYHTLTFISVCAALILTVFATIPDYMQTAKRILFVMEVILVIVFTTELVARVWSSGCRVRYQGIMGRIHFARKPFCIIDITVVISSFVIIFAGNENHTFAATAMRGLRFLQILRMFRVDRRGGTWKLLASVVYAHSKELITAWYIGFLALILASFLVYQAEKDINAEEFQTFADSLWWGLVTLTTIGYGDKTPRSWIGRLIASCFAILGISFFALPAGILGSGFALKVQEQHRQKHLSRRRNPAAYLIQCFWRCYAADVDSRSTATWLESLRGQISHNMKKNVIRRKKFGSSGRYSEMEGTEKANTYENVNSDFVRSAFGKLQERFSSLPSSRNNSAKRQSSSNENITDEDYSERKEKQSSVVGLTEAQKNAIRGIRMMKFSVAKRKFKEALTPYDVKDVIEQYSSGHIDMLSRVKSLQTRIDFIAGNMGDLSPVESTIDERKISTGMNQTELFPKYFYTNSRLANIENNMTKIERKLDLILKNSQQNNLIHYLMMERKEPTSQFGDTKRTMVSEGVHLQRNIKLLSQYPEDNDTEKRPDSRMCDVVASENEDLANEDSLEILPHKESCSEEESSDEASQIVDNASEIMSTFPRQHSAFDQETNVTTVSHPVKFSAPNGEIINNTSSQFHVQI